MAAKSSSALVPAGQSLNLLDAIAGFEGVLDDSERGELKKMRTVPDADAILVFTAELDASHRNRKGPSFASRLHTILSSVGSYCGIVETCVSSHPEIAALVWGAMKLTMLVLTNFTSFYAATSNLFMKLGRLCPPFADYQALYPDSSRLQKALGEFHASIIRCCTHLVQVLRRTTGKRWAKAFLESFDQEFKPDLEDVQNRASDVDHEIRLAHAQAVRQDQELQAVERQEAKESRLSIRQFISRADKTTEANQAMRIQCDERRARKRRQQLVDSLSDRSFLRLFKQNCRRRHYDTTDWIFQTSEFKRWFYEDLPVLWLSGKIGSGKTVATSSVVQYIQRHKASSGSHLSFFFVQAGERDSFSTTTILKSLLQQMIEPSTMPADIYNALQSLHPSSDTEDILDVLRQITPKGRFYLVVDGLDECDRTHAVKLLQALSALVSHRASLRLFLSGRPSLLPDLKRSFIELNHISMECQGVDADIAKYINDAIDMKIDEDELRVGDTALIGEIKNSLIQGAQGMFLWAFFQIEEICSQPCDADIRAALVNLPKDLAQIFHRALQRIATGSHSKVAQSVFQWITYSKRPLTLAELREAIAIELGQRQIEPTRLSNDMDKIATWCQNLVYVDEETLVVQVIHTSVRTLLLEKSTDPFVSMFHIDVDQADQILGEACLTYLDFDAFKRTLTTRSRPLTVSNPIGIVNTMAKPMSKPAKLLSKIPIGSPRSTFDLRPAVDSESSGPARAKMDNDEHHPFLEYASRHWISHTARLREKTSKTWNILQQIISQGHSVAKLPWDDGFQLSVSVRASLKGLPFSPPGTAPGWAWQNDHFAATRILASPEADIPRMAALGGNYNLFDAVWDEAVLEDPMKALLYGATVGHLPAVDTVISRGYDVNTPVPLTTSVSRKHLPIPATTLLRREYEMSGKDYKGAYIGPGDIPKLKEVFEAAPDDGRLDIVAIPFQRPHSETGTNVLKLTKEGSLLGRGFISDIKPGGVIVDPETALVSALTYGHTEVMERLLDAGARVIREDLDRACRALKAAFQNNYDMLTIESQHRYLKATERLLTDWAEVTGILAMDSRFQDSAQRLIDLKESFQFHLDLGEGRN